MKRSGRPPHPAQTHTPPACPAGPGSTTPAMSPAGTALFGGTAPPVPLLISGAPLVLPDPAARAPAAASPPDGLSWSARMASFRVRLIEHPPAGVSVEEIEAHCAGMPAHYWERVSEADVRWALETIHGFLNHVASPLVAPTAPFVSWKFCPLAGCTRMLLATWDRPGLLAKAAAALSAVRLNILQADVHTRADNVVLDEFSVTDAEGRGAVSQDRLKEMSFLLEGALSEPPRFASVWACSRHKFLAPPSPIPPQVEFDNSSPAATVVRLVVADRLGLLYDILQAIAEAGLNVAQARIETQVDGARDVIHVTDAGGGRILEPSRLQALRENLLAAVSLRE